MRFFFLIQKLDCQKVEKLPSLSNPNPYQFMLSNDQSCLHEHWEEDVEQLVHVQILHR